MEVEIDVSMDVARHVCRPTQASHQDIKIRVESLQETSTHATVGSNFQNVSELRWFFGRVALITVGFL